MNTRTKAVVAGASVLVLGGLGTSAALASATGTDLNPLGDGDLDRAEHVALDHVGEGEVTGAETEDDEGVVAYEIEVTRADGTQVDVELDGDHTVLAAIEDGREDDDGDDDGDDDSGDDSDDDRDGDRDDRALGRAERDRAAQVALAEVGRGIVTDVEAEDDVVGGEAVGYEVEVTRADGTEVDVYLGTDFSVLTVVEDGTADDDRDDD